MLVCICVEIADICVEIADICGGLTVSGCVSMLVV